MTGMKEHGDTVANVYATCNIICEKEQAPVEKIILVFSGERDVKTGLTKGPSCSLVLTVWTEIYT